MANVLVGVVTRVTVGGSLIEGTCQRNFRLVLFFELRVMFEWAFVPSFTVAMFLPDETIILFRLVLGRRLFSSIAVVVASLDVGGIILAKTVDVGLSFECELRWLETSVHIIDH